MQRPVFVLRRLASHQMLTCRALIPVSLKANSINEDSITVDDNGPLAGKVLKFDI